MKENKDGTHIGELSFGNFSLLSAAKKKDDKVCLWCGGKLKNDNESFCSVYCTGLWGGEGD